MSVWSSLLRRGRSGLYTALPLKPEQIGLNRFNKRERELTFKMIITVASSKGGVGNTTTARPPRGDAVGERISRFLLAENFFTSLIAYKNRFFIWGGIAQIGGTGKKHAYHPVRLTVSRISLHSPLQS
jgi:hypothetical protein